MIQLRTNQATGSFVIWPESASNQDPVEFRLHVTHSMNLASGSLPVVKINNPNNLSEYLILQAYSGSGIPTASGQYNYNLSERVLNDYTWISASFTFEQAAGKWGGQISTASNVLDSGRLFVSGTNDPDFTIYTSSNEKGAYKTYYT